MANDDQAIRHLIAVLKDGERGFIDIGEHIQNTEQRSYFMEEARVRGGYATELERAVNRTTDGSLDESGTVAGALHRTWGDVKARLGGGDKTLLETAELGEQVAEKAYKAALDDQAVSDTIRALIAQQYEHVQRSHELMKNFTASHA